MVLYLPRRLLVLLFTLSCFPLCIVRFINKATDSHNRTIALEYEAGQVATYVYSKYLHIRLSVTFNNGTDTN